MAAKKMLCTSTAQGTQGGFIYVHLEGCHPELDQYLKTIYQPEMQGDSSTGQSCFGILSMKSLSRQVAAS